MAHTNFGNCLGCAQIFNKYPGFYQPLKDWFFKVQAKHPTFHISCAGRDKIDQETCFARGASKAHWTQSSHNWNAAIDTFFLVNGSYCLDVNLYDALIQEIDESIEWYGAAGAIFPERPHFEMKNWKQLRDSGVITLVE